MGVWEGGYLAVGDLLVLNLRPEKLMAKGLRAEGYCQDQDQDTGWLIPG